MEKVCINCKWFVSWQDVHSDLLEPHDAGRCLNEKSEKFYDGVSSDDTCKHYFKKWE